MAEVEMSRKLCVDCKYSRPREYDYACMRLPSTIDPVTGAQVNRSLSCRHERKSGACGADGRFWEPRPPRASNWLRRWLGRNTGGAK